MLSKLQTTQRGFPLYRFIDRYDKPCSIQKSSLASENAIWLGCDNANPRRMIVGRGWVPYLVPDDVLMDTTMHLTQNQVRELLPILQTFADTGEI